MACLEERRDRLRSLTDIFSHADGKVLIQAVNGAQALPSPRALFEHSAAARGGGAAR